MIDKVQKEPVSEELQEASEKCIKELMPEAELNSATPFALEYVVKLLHETFKAGANWLKEQDLIPSTELSNFVDKLSKQFPEVSFAKLSRIAVRVAKWQKEQEYTCYEEAFEDGAKWKAEQFEEERLKHCDELTEEQAQIESDFVTQHLKENNRTPTFIDAIEHGMRLKEKEMQSTIELAEDHAMLAGMEKMKEELMKDAHECEVKVDAGGYPYIPQIELYDYDKDIPLAEEGDKYKVIVIKEDFRKAITNE